MSGYGSDDGFENWLADNGLSLPSGSPSVAVLRHRGSVYLDGRYGSRLAGTPTGGYAQERAFPRTGVTVYGAALPDSVIPASVIEASYAAGYYEATTPGGLNPAATAAGAVKREKIDVIEVEYFEGGGSAIENATVTIAAVDGLMAPFLAARLPGMLIV